MIFICQWRSHGGDGKPVLEDLIDLMDRERTLLILLKPCLTLQDLEVLANQRPGS